MKFFHSDWLTRIAKKIGKIRIILNNMLLVFKKSNLMAANEEQQLFAVLLKGIHKREKKRFQLIINKFSFFVEFFLNQPLWINPFSCFKLTPFLSWNATNTKKAKLLITNTFALQNYYIKRLQCQFIKELFSVIMKSFDIRSVLMSSISNWFRSWFFFFRMCFVRLWRLYIWIRLICNVFDSHSKKSRKQEKPFNTFIPRERRS